MGADVRPPVEAGRMAIPTGEVAPVVLGSRENRPNEFGEKHDPTAEKHPPGHRKSGGADHSAHKTLSRPAILLRYSGWRLTGIMVSRRPLRLASRSFEVMVLSPTVTVGELRRWLKLLSKHTSFSLLSQ